MKKNETLEELFKYYRESEERLIDIIGRSSDTKLLKFKDFRQLIVNSGFTLGYKGSFRSDGKREVETIWYNSSYGFIVYAETNGNFVGTVRLYGQIKVYDEEDLEFIGKFERVCGYGLKNGILNIIAPLRCSRDFVDMYLLMRIYATPSDWSLNSEWLSNDTTEGFRLVNYEEEMSTTDMRVLRDITEDKVFSNPEILHIVHGQ